MHSAGGERLMEGCAHFSAGLPVSGAPVLFLPGNAGSYAQVRSMASETARQTQRANELAAAQRGDVPASRSGASDAVDSAISGDGWQPVVPGSDSADGGGSCTATSAEVTGGNGGFGDLAWYAADFGEELSAFDGKLLVRALMGAACAPVTCWDALAGQMAG